MVTPETWGLVLLEVLGGLLALAAFAKTWSAYRLTGLRSLWRYGAGVLLVGLSQFLAVVLEISVALPETVDRQRLDHLDVIFWAYHLTLLLGLLGVFWSFGRHPFRWAPVLAPVLLLVGPLLEFVTLLALFFVVLHAGLNHIARKGTGSLQVAIGFFFLLAAHFLNLYTYEPLAPRTLWGETVHLAGFLLLYLAQTRPRT